MKIAKALSLASLVLLVAAPVLAGSGSTSGAIEYSVPGGRRSVEFHANSNGGSADGKLTFSGPAEIVDQDVDGDGTASAGIVNVTVSADVDCLKLSGKRAAISGVVSSSNVDSLVGRRIVLAVEDNGEGNKSAEPDRYTWGSYVGAAGTWFPTDAEVPGDNGASFSWLATDAEDPSDPGFQYHTVTLTTFDCQSFPLASYAFEDIPNGAGNVQVKP